MTTESLRERSLGALKPHLPVELHASVERLLSETPILVRVVKARKTKRGDHRLGESKTHSVITIDASGNAWQFAVTLLHEIAHAQVAHSINSRVLPHGREWKAAFRNLLLEHAPHFPADLRGPVLEYARNPLYSTNSHPRLAVALRHHDGDRGTIVSELAEGQAFSLDGKVVLIKGKLRRTWYLCRSTDGRLFRVRAIARVRAVYEISPAIP